jgi:hypothetical protein
MSILRILCYNGSLVTWTVVRLTTTKFKPIIFSLISLFVAGTDRTVNVSSTIICSVVGEMWPRSCSLATAVILSPVYTAVAWQWVYMSQYSPLLNYGNIWEAHREERNFECEAVCAAFFFRLNTVHLPKPDTSYIYLYIFIWQVHDL